ncbi:MAG: hypothetical protein PVJ91_02765 [Flavobacteriaceae bacterium]|jgi:hypothetical protein
MEKSNPILREKPSVIQKVLKFVLFLVTTAFVFPLTFYKTKRREFGGRATGTFDTDSLVELIQNISDGDFSLLFSFDWISFFNWLRILISLLLGLYFVYFGGYKKALEKSRKQKLVVLLLISIAALVFYSVIILLIFPQLLNYLFG